jgi:hypothetical protein
MKTTIELPDDLLREVKATAARRGDSLKAYFHEAVVEKLEREAMKSQAGQWPVPPLNLTPEEAAEIDQAIEEAFEQIDPEDWV